MGSTFDTDDLGTIEAAVATGAGIRINDVDDVRLDNLIIEGWGMDLPQGGDGSIRSSQQGSNTLMVSNCEWGWTAYHGLLHASASDGGILLVQNCTFGFHVNRDSAFGGGGDGLVSYSPGGNNELIVDACRSFGGGLSRYGSSGGQGDALGMPVYQHSLTGNSIGLHLRRNCTFVPIHPVRAHFADYAAAADCATTVSGAASEFPTDPLDVRCYRAFVIGETADFNGSQFAGTWRCVDINCRWTTHSPASGSGTYLYWGALRNSFCGLSINRDQTIQLDPSFRAYYGLGETQVPHNHIMIGGRFRIIGGAPDMPANSFFCEVNPNLLATCSLYNSVVSNEAVADSPRWNYPNHSPRQNPGGMSHCAFFRVPSAWFDASDAPSTLGIRANYELSLEGSASVPATLIHAGSSTLPRGLTLEYDTLMRRREPVPTIGPLEGTPACPADFNGDGVIDLFDYLDFISYFSANDLRADVNSDQVVDLFDYLDFLAMLDAGC